MQCTVFRSHLILKVIKIQSLFPLTPQPTYFIMVPISRTCIVRNLIYRSSSYSLFDSLINLKPSELSRTKLFNNYPMLLMNLWPKMALNFTLIVIRFCHIILENLLFSHISVTIISTPSLLNNPDTASYHDINCNSLQNESNNPLQPFDPHTSIAPRIYILLLPIKIFLPPSL